MKRISLKEKMLKKLPEEKREKVEKALSIAKTVKNIACWVLVALLAVVLIIFVTTRINGGTPSVFGYSFQRISPGSMEPALHVGDVILCKEVKDVDTLKKGDIITFKGGVRYENNFVTHRIIIAPYTENGVKLLQTQGDANDIPDDPITADSVYSVYERKLGFLNWLYSLFFTPWGLIIFIGLLLILFFDEIINIVRVMSGQYDDEEDEESISEIIERIQREDNRKRLAEAQRDLELKQHEIAEKSKKDIE